jgi:hypothetical protein
VAIPIPTCAKIEKDVIVNTPKSRILVAIDPRADDTEVETLIVIFFYFKIKKLLSHSIRIMFAVSILITASNGHYDKACTAMILNQFVKLKERLTHRTPIPAMANVIRNLKIRR